MTNASPTSTASKSRGYWLAVKMGVAGVFLLGIGAGLWAYRGLSFLTSPDVAGRAFAAAAGVQLVVDVLGCLVKWGERRGWGK